MILERLNSMDYFFNQEQAVAEDILKHIEDF